MPFVRRIAVVLSIVVTYAAAVAWLTWPLAAHLATALPDTAPPCRFDTLSLTWALAHQSRTLVRAPSALPHGNIYHPDSYSLFYGEAGFGAVPYFLPPFLLTGNPTLAANVTWLGGVVLAASALHLVVLRWTASNAAGFVAAWTFLTTRWVLWTWLPHAPNYALLHYLPWIVSIVAGGLAARSTASLLVVLVVLQGLVSPYVAAATLAPLAFVGVIALVRRRRTTGWRVLGSAATAAVLLFASYLGVVWVRLHDTGLSDQSVWRAHRLRPTVLPWDLFAQTAPAAVVPAALALVVLGFALRRRFASSDPAAPLWRVAVAWTVAGLIVSLPPVVTWGGRSFGLPWSPLVAATPLYEVIRFPERLAVASLFGLSLLAGLAIVTCARVVTAERGRAVRSALALGFAIVAYREYATGTARGDAAPPLPAAYPLFRPVGPEAPLMDLLARPGGPLLELPLGPLRGGDTAADAPFQARSVYRSIFHRRPILNGYTSYWPTGFSERMALARRLPDADALSALREQTGLELILVHARLFGALERSVCARLAARRMSAEGCRGEPGAAERAAWLTLAARDDREDLRLVARAGDDLLFAVTGIRSVAR